MSDEVTENQGSEGDASAGTENTVQKPTEHMIPKSRFDDVNAKLKSVEAKLAAYETAQMTEAQKLQAQMTAAQQAAEAAQAELRKARAEAAVAREAGKLGVDPALVLKLVELEYDEQGQPVGVAERVQAVLTTWPHLKPQAVTVAATNPGRAQKLTRADLDKMSIDEINNRWDEVQTVLAGG